MYDWDETKRLKNLAKHRVDFAEAAAFDWATSISAADDRSDYGETREWALGLIGERLHYLAFTRRDQMVRVISLRKANQREFDQWIRQTS